MFEWFLTSRVNLMQFQITDFLKTKQRHIESTGLGFLHKVHQYLSPHGLSPR